MTFVIRYQIRIKACSLVQVHMAEYGLVFRSAVQGIQYPGSKVNNGAGAIGYIAFKTQLPCSYISYNFSFVRKQLFGIQYCNTGSPAGSVFSKTGFESIQYISYK